MRLQFRGETCGPFIIKQYADSSGAPPAENQLR